MKSFSRVALAVISLNYFGLVLAAAEVEYPNRPIRIVVGFTPGGGNDIIARVVGQKLSESLGQPVIIENKPGAGAILATEYVARSAPDDQKSFDVHSCLPWFLDGHPPDGASRDRGPQEFPGYISPKLRKPSSGKTL